jgi:hypothetical protein
VQLFPLSGSVAQLKLLPDPLSIPLLLGEWEQTKSTPLPAQTLIPVPLSHGFPKLGLAVQGAALPVSPLVVLLSEVSAPQVMSPLAQAALGGNWSQPTIVTNAIIRPSRMIPI